MTCLHCQREFTPRQWNHRFCSDQCRRANSRETRKRQLIAQITFEREWAQWKKDFAGGKTESNLRSG